MNIGEFTITLEYTVDNINELVNMFNTPIQVPVTVWAKHIDLIQQQAAPQIMKLQTDLEAVKKTQEENKDEE